MSKVTLADIPGGYASVAALNNRFALIEAAFDNTVSRDGTLPNTMTANLDLNSNDVLNVNSIAMTSMVLAGETITSRASLVGPEGPVGPQGPQGDVGPQGPQGEKGDAAIAADLLFETNPVALNLSSAADFTNGGPILLRRIDDLVTAYIGSAFHSAAAVRGAAGIIPAGWRPASNLDIEWLTPPSVYVSIPELDVSENIVGEDYRVFVEVNADGDVIIAYYNPDGTPRADQQYSPTVSLSWICIPT